LEDLMTKTEAKLLRVDKKIEVMSAELVKLKAEKKELVIAVKAVPVWKK